MKNLPKVTQVTYGRAETQKEAVCPLYVLLFLLVLIAPRVGYCEYHFPDQKIQSHRVYITFSRSLS